MITRNVKMISQDDEIKINKHVKSISLTATAVAVNVGPLKQSRTIPFKSLSARISELSIIPIYSLDKIHCL